MMKVVWSLWVASFAVAGLHAQTLTGAEILKKIDENLVLDRAISTSTMVIHSRTGTRSIEQKSWIEGKDKSFVEFLDPPREKGKKMLKLADQLWTYTPEPTDRIIAISGHLLRQSVMGSDLSYEDMTENRKLVDLYDAQVIGSEDSGGRPCLVLELTAKEPDVTYYSRKLWVDKERFLPLREERYAKSGRLLKTTEFQEVVKIENRWYPKKILFKDVLSRGDGTEYIIESLNLHALIPDNLFTKASLRK